MATTLSEKREEVWFWGFFAVLGIILAAIGWLRAMGVFGWLRGMSLFGVLVAASAPPPAASLHPVPAIDAIVEALRTHDVVGADTGHGGAEQEHAFLVSLVRDPRVAEIGVDLAYEGLGGRFQAAMDRYVTGENVTASDLAPIWNETTQQQIPGPVWTGEVPGLFRAVRSVNAPLPRAKQIRVLLGDPPIEWERVHTAEDFQAWLAQRDSYPADVIRRDVLARKRHALVLFGGGHLQRKQQVSNYRMESPLAQTVVSLLERAGATTFVIRTRGDEPATKSWPVPSLAAIRGTDFGAAPEPQGSLPRMKIVDGRLLPLPRDEWISIPQEDQFDAVLYLGSQQPPPPLPAAAICADAAYLRVRLERMAISGLPPSVPDRLRSLCRTP